VRTGIAEQETSGPAPASRRRPRAVVLVLAGLLVAALVAMLVLREQVADHLGLADRGLQSAVEAAFEQAESDEVVVLEDVTGFEWDAVGVFHPYYPHDAIVEEMGVPVPRAVTNRVQSQDTHCLLVFRSGDAMVGWTALHRDVATCWPEDAGPGPYAPSEARFAAESFTPAGPAAARD
jgi:hypothetical protein